MRDGQGEESGAQRFRRWMGKPARALLFPDRAMARLDHAEVEADEARRASDALSADIRAVRSQLDELAELHHRTLARLDGIDRRLDGLDDAAATAATVADVASVSARIGAQLNELSTPTVEDGPLVSVIVPTFQRADRLAGALSSVATQSYRRWECIVVDDGGDDDTAHVVDALDDDRFRYVHIPHGGVAHARNRGLELATGDIIAYLDSDNRWHRHHLAAVVDALSSDPAAGWVLTGQIVADGQGAVLLRNDTADERTLIDHNFADLNAIAHRRSALEVTGTFDESLRRLSDWDLVLRLHSASPLVRRPLPTSVYRTDAPDRIDRVEQLGLPAHVVRRRHRGQPLAGARVLLAEWHFPQLTESYIAATAAGLRAIGADVQVWAQERPGVPAENDLVVHGGQLADTLRHWKPDVVLTHWLQKGREFRVATAQAGIPHVVREHGFEHDVSVLNELLSDPGVLVQTYAHLVDPTHAGHPRLHDVPTCFDDERFLPRSYVQDKDHSLVLRTGAGLHTKEMLTFAETARRCPDHRFVLVLGHALHVEHQTEEIIAAIEASGAPVDIRVDVAYRDMVDLFAAAGTYLHTSDPAEPPSMPISIAEAMATGGRVIAADRPGVRRYLGAAGATYRGATIDDRADHAAALIRASQHWSADRWAGEHDRAQDQAFGHFASRDVADAMTRRWDEVLRIGLRRSGR